MTTISVVIPAYNAQSFLSRAIESALSQRLPPAEILVIDDGSTDQTLEAASAFGDRVKAFRKTNGGPASARNFGIQQAKGAWIALLDADDAWVPEKLEEQVKLIDSRVGLIHAKARGRVNSIETETTFADLWERNRILNSSVLLRRDAYVQIGGFDEDPALIGVEDYNFWLRLAASGWKICGSSKELCLYTPAPDSLSRQVLRFATAELMNARKLSRLLSLTHDELCRKELSILDQYGLELLHIRDLSHAREYFLQGLRRQLGARRAFRCAATLLPKAILDWRRVVARSLLRKDRDKISDTSVDSIST
jgi:cellulose synthase/poly-beta-1,6-N-acetylglucosamine synthase-like glycosyltransferase